MRDFFFSIDASNRLALVNGYPIVSEESIAPARPKQRALFKAKSETETTTLVWWDGSWGAREAEGQE